MTVSWSSWCDGPDFVDMITQLVNWWLLSKFWDRWRVSYWSGTRETNSKFRFFRTCFIGPYFTPQGSVQSENINRRNIDAMHLSSIAMLLLGYCSIAKLVIARPVSRHHITGGLWWDWQKKINSSPFLASIGYHYESHWFNFIPCAEFVQGHG